MVFLEAHNVVVTSGVIVDSKQANIT